MLEPMSREVVGDAGADDATTHDDDAVVWHQRCAEDLEGWSGVSAGQSRGLAASARPPAPGTA